MTALAPVLLLCALFTMSVSRLIRAPITYTQILLGYTVSGEYHWAIGERFEGTDEGTVEGTVEGMYMRRRLRRHMKGQTRGQLRGQLRGCIKGDG